MLAVRSSLNIKTLADGKIQGLAVTAKTPHPLFKQYPAMAAIKGLESMEFDIWSGILLHKNTPDPIVAVLNKAFESSGNVVLPARNVAELTRVYGAEIERYRAMAKAINLQSQ